VAGDLPEDWRARMLDMIRGVAPLDGEWFSGGPVCSPLDQIGIYAQQYRLRLHDALNVEVLGVRALVGDRADDLYARYLRAHPSQAWTLNRVADAFAGWLAEQPDVEPVVVEMARLDWAVQHGFEAADGEELDPARLMTLPPLVLQPHVHLVRCTWNVHEVRSAALSREPLPALRQGDFPLVVFRRERWMRHWVAPLGLWGILEAIGEGLTVQRAIDRVFTRGWTTTEELAEHIGGWFRDLAERRLVSVR
jgi:hypothetical protein